MKSVQAFITRHKIKFTLAIALVLLVLLLIKVDIVATIKVMSEFDWRWMGIGAVIIISSFLLNTYRWQLLLQGHQQQLGFWLLLKFRMIGTLYGDVLPSEFSGDMMRAYYLTKHESLEMSVSFSTVIVEKISNVLALFVFLFVAIAINTTKASEAGIWRWLMIAIGVFVIGVVVLYSRKFQRVVLSRIINKNISWLRFVKKYYEAIHVYRNQGGVFISSIIISLIIIGLSMVLNQVVFFGLGVHLTFVDVVLVISIITLSNSIPVSFGNIGYRESVAVYMLQFFGVAAVPALAFALMMRLIRLLTSLSGLFVLVFQRDTLLPSPRK